MKKNELFKGPNYSTGINGKKILVVGHQIGGDKEEHNDTDIPNTKNDNIDLINEVINGGWGGFYDKSFTSFARLMTGDRSISLHSQKSKDMWNSIAFCNFIQVPNRTNSRTGCAAPELYEYALKCYDEYLEDIEPDVVIVWGSCCFDYIGRRGKVISDRRRLHKLPSGKQIDVVQIIHPCVMRYDPMEKLLREVGVITD